MNSRTRGLIAVVGMVAGLISAGAASAADVAAKAPESPRVLASTSNHTWAVLDRTPAEILQLRPHSRPAKGQPVQVNLDKVREVLQGAPLEGTPRAKAEPAMLELPLPDGTFERFKVVESPLMHPSLAKKYPEIRNYLISGVDDPLAVGRMTIAPEGFHALFYTSADMVSISRVSLDNNQYHVSYWMAEYFDKPALWSCGTVPGQMRPGVTAMRPRGDRGPGVDPSSRSGETRSDFFLAMSATAEYVTQFGTGAGESRRASIMTLFNQMVTNINVPYERDVCTRLTLAANTDQAIQLDPAFMDAFSDPETVPVAQAENVGVLAAAVGTTNYDIGHIIHFTGQGNGNAGDIGTVCVDVEKGRGYSATDVTYGAASPFDVVIVAHEFGHQFGGRHNFNNCAGGPREDLLVCVEPGSGSTIMSYTGICPGTDLAMQSIAMFDQLNFDQMFAYLSTGTGASCADLTPTGNHPPTVNAGPDFIIPSKTPFALTAGSSDADNDTLTYSWETKNVGPVMGIPLQPSADNGQSPINRVFAPSASPTRMVPQLAKLLNPTPADIADMLPQVNRLMEWRVTARDNHPGGGGVATDDMNVQVIGFAGPFRVLTPAAGANVNSVTTVTWDPAATNGAPINCTDVRILLSTDGGNTFPINLLPSTPNTGTATVIMPNIATIQARLKVEAIGNIFFNISPGNFRISAPPAGVDFRLSGTATVSDTVGNGNSTGSADPGETSVRLTVPIINAGGTTATGVSATLTTTTPTASIVSGFATYSALPYGQVAANAAPFVISVAPNHACGTPINLRLTVNSLEGSTTTPLAFTIPTGTTGGAGALLSFPYVGNPVPIPNNDPNGITIPFSVSAFGAIADVDFRFDGSACSALTDDPNVGLTHSFVGDLIISLTSPQGTTVLLADRPGRQLAPASGSSGNNFCQTNFNDDGNFTGIQAASPANAPYTGSFKPAQALTAFDGQNANGVWTLKIADVAGLDTGTFRAATLRLTPNNPPGCSAPAATGACCLGSVCVITNSNDCTAQTGNYSGNNTSCSPNPCQAAQGACCLGSTCSLVADSSACTGRFAGAGVACNAAGNATTPCCKADFNQLGSVTVQDVFDFLNAWFASDPKADFNGSGVTVQDVFDYLAAWFTGCP